MRDATRYLNLAVASLLALVLFCAPVAAGDRLDRLLDELPSAAPEEARRIAREIELEWAKSGSPAMDLLLRRGKEALEADETARAIEHLGAAIDHAPGFAEAWFLRSVAFFRQERYGLALNDIAQVLAREPRHFNAILGMGRVFEETGRPALARDAYVAAHTIHPHHEDISKGLDRVSRMLGGAEL